MTITDFRRYHRHRERGEGKGGREREGERKGEILLIS